MKMCTKWQIVLWNVYETSLSLCLCLIFCFVLRIGNVDERRANMKIKSIHFISNSIWFAPWFVCLFNSDFTMFQSAVERERERERDEKKCTLSPNDKDILFFCRLSESQYIYIVNRVRSFVRLLVRSFVRSLECICCKVNQSECFCCAHWSELNRLNFR